MRIHLLSDLHNSIGSYRKGKAAKEADVIVMVGDIGCQDDGLTWMRDRFEQPIVYVLGNLEYYGGGLSDTVANLKSMADDRIHVLENDSVVIDGVRFLGATAWTDYTATDSEANAINISLQRMRDFNEIKNDEGNYVGYSDFQKVNRATKQWFSEQLSLPFAGKTVAITHHAPSMASRNPKFDSSDFDASFSNAWDDIIPLADVWLHGHTHWCVDYMLGRTRVCSNSYGYQREKTGYRNDLLIEV